MTTLVQKMHNQSSRPSMRLLIEQYLHLALGVIGFFVAVIFSHLPFAYIVAKDWDYGSIYTSIFDLSTVYSALMFGFVTYLKTSQSKFLEKISPRLLHGAVRYARHAYSLGVSVIVVSIPFIVLKPVPETPLSASSFFFAAWFGLTVSAVFASVRASRLFWVIMKGDRERD